jgi:surface polysaccharide O-acyltransferase-like enzyme
MGHAGVYNELFYPNDKEASAICVSCGKPVCNECNILLKDNKMHCKQCVLNGRAITYEKTSWAWWLLPTLFAILGGLIAFIANGNKNNQLRYVRSSDYFFVGVLVTISWGIIIVITTN